MVERILIASTVRQKPAVLKEFLLGLAELDLSGLKFDFLFIDNNDEEDATWLLQTFGVPGSTTYLAREKPQQDYLCSEQTHQWTGDLVWKVASYKDSILQFTREKDYSHVFLVDSDLVLHPQTLKQLLAAQKDIISEIFWTEWTPGTGKMPQVWLSGNYNFRYGDQSFNNGEAYQKEANSLLQQWLLPGVYEVGGLGACTLVSSQAIARGVSFKCIKNVDYWGEDRHFCIRASVLGLGLYVDTHYPAYHIYRESDLPGVETYQRWIKGESLKTGIGTDWKRKNSGNKLTLSMIVRNEAGRYLREVLEHAKQYIDSAVIIDDASTDNTVQICREILEGIPFTIIELEESLFKTENRLRQIQWEETIKTKPDWILTLDADELFENRVLSEIRPIINQNRFDVMYFRLYDFWNQDHFREDDYWQAHNSYRPLLVRYIPDQKYIWQDTPLHCGRLPANIQELPGAASNLRVKHLGWSKPEDRELKYRRYLDLDPEGQYGIMEQYQSILDPQPRLVKWEE